MDASIAIKVVGSSITLTTFNQSALTSSTYLTIDWKCRSSHYFPGQINSHIWSGHIIPTRNHPSSTVYATLLEYKSNASLAAAVDPINVANYGFDGLTRRRIRRKQRSADGDASTNAINDHNDAKYDESVSISIDSRSTSSDLVRAPKKVA